MSNEYDYNRIIGKTKEEIYSEGIDRKKLANLQELKMPIRTSGNFIK